MAKKKVPRCPWCKEKLTPHLHPDTVGLCFIRNEKQIRSRARPRVRRVSDVYEEGRIKSEFIGTDMEDKLMQRQRQLAIDASLTLGSNGYKVPRNVSRFLAGDLVWNQIALEKPWAVYVLVPLEGGGSQRKRRRFNNLYQAVEYHKKIHDRFPSSGIVSLGKSYELPAQWRFKKEQLPKKFKWCPRCADFRVFRRVEPGEQFFAMTKRPTTDAKKIERGIMFEWTERALWLTECQLCGLPNRDAVFRRNNLPWEKRRIKQGVRRVKPRIRTERGKKNKARKGKPIVSGRR